MKRPTRRDVWMGFALAGQGAKAADLAGSEVFPFDRMPVSRMANGGESRDIVRGSLATGESVALHESTQRVGSKPNPAHTIQHTEFIFVREGTLAFEHDGKTENIGPGGIALVAPGTLHLVRNVGDTSATYIVIAIGGDVKQ